MEWCPKQGQGSGKFNGDFLASCRGGEDYDTYGFLLAKALEELEFWENGPTGLYSLPSSSQSIDMDVSYRGIEMYFKGVLFFQRE